jgi:hypothetical protein
MGPGSKKWPMRDFASLSLLKIEAKVLFKTFPPQPNGPETHSPGRQMSCNLLSSELPSSKGVKHEKTCSNNQHDFIPFSFETFGFLAPEVIDLLKSSKSYV